MKNYIIFIIIIILIITTAIILITSKKGENKIETYTRAEQIKQNTIPKGEVGIVSQRQIGYGQIEVIIKNNTGNELKEVKVKANCWDKNGNNLGTYSNGQRNVNTTDKYKIKIFCSADMKKYELELSYQKK